MKLFGVVFVFLAAIATAWSLKDPICAQQFAKNTNGLLRCAAKHRAFSYRWDIDECLPFIYGGCFGNSNNFDSLEECERKCKEGTRSNWRITYPTDSNWYSKRITLEGGAEPPWLQGPLKAAFLGASGVGKTSILQQFFNHDFPKSHQTTTRRKVYKNCLVCDTWIRELMVLDVPPQNRFPTDNFAEWNNGHPLGLRAGVHAYVLVFDMGNLQTFQYCRSMRDQILDSFCHRNFSIIVVGNKYDTITEAQANAQELKDISTLVRKHWRCGYVECSAQYNYKIGEVFRELMGCTGGSGAGNVVGNAIIGSELSQSNRNKSFGRCTIL